MDNQNKIDELHERVSAWSERASDGNMDAGSILDDPEFLVLVGELIEQDEDTLMRLVGRAALEAGEMPWFNLKGDDD